ncbi:MAG: tetratricopeptide repeat protein [Methylococcales bacterium]|nr:tetratricopeptide repeat protein [Methylococcales bacterium]
MARQINAIRYHKWTAKYDDNGKQIELAYFDRDNRPILPDNNEILNGLGYVFYNQKNYNEAAKIFAYGLAKFPNDLDLLTHDLEMALAQDDRARFQQRLKVLSTLLKPQDRNYFLIPFLSYLANPQQGYQAVIDAIEKLNNNLQINWNFSDIQPAIDRQNLSTQKSARLFIDYFEGRIDLKTLKSKLAV